VSSPHIRPVIAQSYLSRVQILKEKLSPELLKGTRIGLEKESLRVSDKGGIALTNHPHAWGHPLTNSILTTDYSEALTEFITPAFCDVGDALDYLADLQSYAYQSLQKELLWATSMPCVLYGDHNIPIAEYGDSNIGKMKHIYREGLGLRYGRVMQVIAGVHFNWSLPEAFWPEFSKALGKYDSPEECRDTYYMRLVRNVLRGGWLIPYLFGASPAVCKSFFPNGVSHLPKFDDATYFEPYATSLRMGDIGYQNSKEEGLGIRADYNSVESYAQSLLRAITTPAEPWQRLGVSEEGEYRQLNANILQIENEYYSQVRPKPALKRLQSPAVALLDSGVNYIELRSLDVNAYHPLGVDEVQLRFLEAWLLMCMLSDSPSIDESENRELNENLLAVAHRGREPNIQLRRQGESVSLQEWGHQLLSQMYPICELLDKVNGGSNYEDALDEQIGKIIRPQLTPSARMLTEMEDNAESFYGFAQRLSKKHQRFLLERDISDERRAQFDQLIAKSHEDFAALSNQDSESFDQFLENYFAQTYAAVKTES